MMFDSAQPLRILVDLPIQFGDLFLEPWKPVGEFSEVPKNVMRLDDYSELLANKEYDLLVIEPGPVQEDNVRFMQQLRTNHPNLPIVIFSHSANIWQSTLNIIDYRAVCVDMLCEDVDSFKPEAELAISMIPR